MFILGLGIFGGLCLKSAGKKRQTSVSSSFHKHVLVQVFCVFKLADNQQMCCVHFLFLNSLRLLALPFLATLSFRACCSLKWSSSALRSRPGHAHIRPSNDLLPNTWPLHKGFGIEMKKKPCTSILKYCKEKLQHIQFTQEFCNCFLKII